MYVFRWWYYVVVLFDNIFGLIYDVGWKFIENIIYECGVCKSFLVIIVIIIVCMKFLEIYFFLFIFIIFFELFI